MCLQACVLPNLAHYDRIRARLFCAIKNQLRLRTIATAVMYVMLQFNNLQQFLFKTFVTTVIYCCNVLEKMSINLTLL
jgi:hypothetical protein